MAKDIICLAIETSCDETSVAIVKNGREVLSNVISTQIDIHKKYGGVVPEIASRNHVEKPADVLKIGQEVTAKIVDFNLEDKKISLSMKALEAPAETKEEAVEE